MGPHDWENSLADRELLSRISTEQYDRGRSDAISSIIKGFSTMQTDKLFSVTQILGILRTIQDDWAKGK